MSKIQLTKKLPTERGLYFWSNGDLDSPVITRSYYCDGYAEFGQGCIDAKHLGGY